MLDRPHAAPYGVNDKQPCPDCSAPMFVCRRAPATKPGCELQLLTCSSCSATRARTVDAEGRVLND